MYSRPPSSKLFVGSFLPHIAVIAVRGVKADDPLYLRQLEPDNSIVVPTLTMDKIHLRIAQTVKGQHLLQAGSLLAGTRAIAKVCTEQKFARLNVLNCVHAHRLLKRDPPIRRNIHPIAQLGQTIPGQFIPRPAYRDLFPAAVLNAYIKCTLPAVRKV